jgi:hypothetical protein
MVPVRCQVGRDSAVRASPRGPVASTLVWRASLRPKTGVPRVVRAKSRFARAALKSSNLTPMSVLATMPAKGTGVVSFSLYERTRLEGCANGLVPEALGANAPDAPARRSPRAHVLVERVGD